MHYKQKNIKKVWIAGISCCLLAFSFTVQSKAEEMPEQKTLPSFGGKLDLTPQVQEERTENTAEEKSLATDENRANMQKNAEQAAQAAKNAEQQRPVTQKDIILAPGHYNNNSVMMQEDGSNVMIVHGTNKIPENYTNSTNINNGFYMNITNPDGSGMNMGTWANSSSNSISPRKQSKAQMIIDKME